MAESAYEDRGESWTTSERSKWGSTGERGGEGGSMVVVGVRGAWRGIRRRGWTYSRNGGGPDSSVSR